MVTGAHYPDELTKAFDEADQPTNHFLVVNETKRLEARIRELEQAINPGVSSRRSSRIRLAQPSGSSAELDQARDDMRTPLQWLSFIQTDREAVIRKAKELRDKRNPIPDRTRKADDYDSDSTAAPDRRSGSRTPSNAAVLSTRSGGAGLEPTAGMTMAMSDCSRTTPASSEELCPGSHPPALVTSRMLLSMAPPHCATWMAATRSRR